MLICRGTNVKRADAGAQSAFKPEEPAMSYAKPASICLAALAACVWSAVACAQTAYPVKPVRVIVGFPPASGADIMARVISQRVGEAMGQQFPVDNRPGAGSSIAAGLVAKAAPDGYTLFIGTIANAINASLYARLPFDFARDFAPIAPGGSSPNMLVVHPSVPVRTVAELIKLAKSKPGQLSFGSSGVGTLPHLAAEMFNGMAGLKMTHIPYKGSPQATFDLIGGQFELMFGIGSAVMPEVKHGRLRAVAVTTLARLPALPEVPTIAESGLPGFEAVTWFGFVAPAGTPREIIMKLNAEMTRVTALPEVKQQLSAQSIDTLNSTPEQFATYIRDEIAKWARVVKTSGARAE
jgi:tripartite-type tricarboxylate transporter receptor subunit TctC